MRDYSITIIENQEKKQKPDPNQLEFGKPLYRPYVFIMDYTEGTGWHDPPNCTLSAYLLRSCCYDFPLWTNRIRRA